MSAAAPTSIATRSRGQEDEILRRPLKVDVKFLLGRIKDMEDERSTYLSHWRDIAQFMMPRRGHHLKRKRADGAKYNQKIVNGRATKSIRRAVSGFQSGMTPRTRPWFLFEPEIAEEDDEERFEQQSWTNAARRVVFSVLQRSNFYQSTQICYSDFVPFGVGCMQIDEDPGPTVIRTRVHPIGSYLIDSNDEGVIDTFARCFNWTLKQCIDKFGMDKMPPQLQAQAKKSIGSKVDVWNCIYPNAEYMQGALGPRGKAFTSVWWIKGFEDHHGPTRVGGYDEFPIFAPRFWRVGDEPWGQSPGMDALPDVKMLQTECKLKAQGLEKQVWPPMKGPGSLARKAPSQLPGSFQAVSDGAETLQPQYEVNFNLAAIYQDIAILEHAIADTFFETIFTAIMDTARRQRTLGEVEKIESEKFMMLGPVLENLIDDLLEPAITRVFSICERRGLIPEVPTELAGNPLKVTFVSILAQAQKALEAVGVEQTVGFAASLVDIFPEVHARVDIDDAIERYAEAVGGQEIVRSRSEAEEMREQEQAALQRQAMQQQMAEAAEIAKTASETSMEGDSALTRVADQFAGGNA